MEINGSQNIGAPRQKVWDALNDPVVLKQCLPGCESVERINAEEFVVVIAAAIGPLRARFKGRLTMSEAKPPESCVMVFEGQGGGVGFGKGSSTVALAETEDGTTLSYTANAQVGGKLAQVGSRMIDSVARKMADDFFVALRRQLVPSEMATSVASEETNSGSQSVTSKERPCVPLDSTHPPAPSVPMAPGTTAMPALVPAWWLAVAVLLGAVTSLAGVMLAR